MNRCCGIGQHCLQFQPHHGPSKVATFSYCDSVRMTFSLQQFSNQRWNLMSRHLDTFRAIDKIVNISHLIDNNPLLNESSKSAAESSDEPTGSQLSGLSSSESTQAESFTSHVFSMKIAEVSECQQSCQRVCAIFRRLDCSETGSVIPRKAIFLKTQDCSHKSSRN
jgi:hypothetical protein